jgi:hypothetical protein
MNGEPWIMLISRSHLKVSVRNVPYRTEATQGISSKWLPHTVTKPNGKSILTFIT